MDLVNQLLENEKRAREATTVQKHIELDFDLGSLVAIDENDIKSSLLDSRTLLNIAREDTQLLVNKLWALPHEQIDEIVVATLPKPTVILPRSLPVPKAKEPTKWEKFAKEKGIQKKKKDKLKWDDILKKWVPLHGYKKAAAEKEKEWLIEVPGNADPYEDQFEKRKSEKSERVAKNEFQRLRNLAKAKNVKVPKVGLTPTADASSSKLGAALTLAKASTASLGKFQAKLPKEKDAKNVKEMLPGNRKRKLPPLQLADERQKSLGILDKILNKKPKINIDYAVEKEVNSMNSEENKKPRAKKGKKSKSSGKTKKGAKGGKYRAPQGKKSKGSGGKKTRVGGKTTGGRKRR